MKATQFPAFREKVISEVTLMARAIGSQKGDLRVKAVTVDSGIEFTVHDPYCCIDLFYGTFSTQLVEERFIRQLADSLTDAVKTIGCETHFDEDYA